MPISSTHTTPPPALTVPRLLWERGSRHRYIPLSHKTEKRVFCYYTSPLRPHIPHPYRYIGAVLYSPCIFLECGFFVCGMMGRFGYEKMKDIN